MRFEVLEDLVDYFSTELHRQSFKSLLGQKRNVSIFLSAHVERLPDFCLLTSPEDIPTQNGNPEPALGGARHQGRAAEEPYPEV